MEVLVFNNILSDLIARGYDKEINWQRNLKQCNNSFDFANECCWVIINSGMKEQIARLIWERIIVALNSGIDISTVFKHKGKVAAINYVINNCGKLYEEYVLAENKLECVQKIPFIGKITCWHLLKNLGEDVVKPDRHLVRIAEQYNTTPDLLCVKLSELTGEKKCVIDIVLWRACNLKLI